MAPIRGYKKRKKNLKNVEPNTPDPQQDDDSVDWWDEFSKRINGLISPPNGLDKFEFIFKISRKTFNYICSLVKEEMMVKTGNFVFTNGKPLSLKDRVAVAIRRLGSGDSLLTIGDSFGLNHSTVSQVTWRFVEAMEAKALHHLKFPKTDFEIKKTESKFEKIQGLPNCCGAIDSTHIMMLLPNADPTINMWLDSQENHSMILQAIVDSKMRFLDIVTGYPGKMTDSSILKNSNFYKLCEDGKILNGDKIGIFDGSELSEYIVGDSGFPLLPWLITPYQGNDLQDFKTEFNKRHYETQIVASRALARLKKKWKIIEGVMWRPDKTRLPKIILVCCLLHNIVIDMEDYDDGSFSFLHDFGYEQQICEFVDKKGSLQRDNLALYLSGKLAPS